MHPRNRYREPHDFTALCRLTPELKDFLITTPDGRTSLDFSQGRAVYLLNRTLLLRDYGLKHWDIPADNLTPPVPGRLDYIHALHDLDPKAKRVLDIGTGASVIYPILGVREYGWKFVGSDIHPGSVKVARAIVSFNPQLKKNISVRLQADADSLFGGIIEQGEFYDLTMCNPPFFESREAARAAALKKWEKLGRKDEGLSFGGGDHELWTPGGEPAFLGKMILESRKFSAQVGWFTTLVSKKGYLARAHQQLERAGASEVKEIKLSQGNKKSRMLAWKM